MRILLYGLNYAPELTGIGKYTGELGAWLTERGHEVRVITSPPYYPAWKIDPAYHATSYRMEHRPGEPAVFRVPLWVPAQPTGLKRILHLLSFAVSSVPVLCLQPLWQPDVIFNVEPAFFSAPLAWLLARFCGARCWLHVQDFEVDAAFELGLVPRDSMLERMTKAVEASFTRRFDRVSTLSNGMLTRLAAKGVPAGKRVLFPNWAPLDHDSGHAGPCSTLRRELNLVGKVVILYSGNMGTKQGLDLIPALARSVADDPRLVFLLCGEGAFRAELERQTAGLANVQLMPLQPAETLGALLRTADIHLLPQRAGAADLVMPSKLGGMLASGRPVLATAERGTEVARTVEGRGLVVPPGDAERLRRALLQLADDRELRERLGAEARIFAQEHLGREQVLRRFEGELIDLIRERG